MIKKGFASDNNSGVSPEVIQKITEINIGHTVGYGDDPYTGKAIDLLKEHFGKQAQPFFVFTGTAANVLGVTASVKSYNSIICAETAHIYVDECSAPEKFAGCKLIPVKTKDGKLNVDLIKPFLTGFGFEHHAQPGIISITQSTEMGTLYSKEEIEKLAETAHKHGMYLHMDGARLANAAVGLGCGFKDFTVGAGVDVLSFGGTKNGLMFAESVIFFNTELAKDFKYIRKQGMQLTSKMRFISAQFIAYLENDLWKRNATHSNMMAQKLYNAVKDISQVKVTQKVQSNGVFAIIPKEIIPALKEEFFFYDWNENIGEVRWMCSFDTTEDDILRFVEKLKKLISKKNLLS
jgi:threonine aldolase